jgi:hypothetical protein
MRKSYQASAPIQRLLELIERNNPTVVNVNDAQARLFLVTEHLPGNDVRVVFQTGDQHLIAGFEHGHFELSVSKKYRHRTWMIVHIPSFVWKTVMNAKHPNILILELNCVVLAVRRHCIWNGGRSVQLGDYDSAYQSGWT